jgi:hypothetical protein
VSIRTTTRAIFPTLALLAATNICNAQASQPATTEPSAAATQAINNAASKYEFNVTAGVWGPRLGGDVSLGPSPAANDINLEDQFDLDDFQTIPNVELSMRKNEKWEIFASGFQSSTDSDGPFVGHEQFGSLALNTGDQIDASFDITSVEVEFDYWQWRPCIMGTVDGSKECRLDLRAGPIFGVRYVDVDQSVTLVGGGSEDTGGEWLSPFVGFQFQVRYNTPDSFPLIRVAEVGAGAAIGPAIGGDGGTIAQLRAGITAYFNQQAGLTFGYRLIQINVEKDDYTLNGGLQGLFLAGHFRF